MRFIRKYVSPVCAGSCNGGTRSSFSSTPRIARVASERSVELGAEVGYEVRFDRRVSSTTRLRFVTEGVLTRRLLSDPELRGVGAVIIDEFHERHLDGDLALALVERLRNKRPELRLVVMSATLDAEPVAAFLGDAPIVLQVARRDQ